MVVGVKVPKNAAKRQKATKNCSNFLKSNKNLTQTAGVFFLDAGVLKISICLADRRTGRTRGKRSSTDRHLKTGKPFSRMTALVCNIVQGFH